MTLNLFSKSMIVFSLFTTTLKAKPNHLIHSSVSLFRSLPFLCPVTSKKTVRVGTLKPKNTAGKTFGDIVMAKQRSCPRCPNARTHIPLVLISQSAAQ